MASRKNFYKVDFSIDNLSLKEQQHIFEVLLSQLNYNQRQDLHITVTDPMGGKHFIWDGYGIDPNGLKCLKCNAIDCTDCPSYKRRGENKNG